MSPVVSPYGAFGWGAFGYGAFGYGGSPWAARARYKVEVGWGQYSRGLFTFGFSHFGGPDTLAASSWDQTFTGPHDDVTNPGDGTRVAQLRVTRGRDDDLSFVRAGEATIDLVDWVGKYNPENAASVLHGQLSGYKPVRITAFVDGVAYPIFYGFTDQLSYLHGRRRGTAQIHAVDFLARLNPPGAGSGDTNTANPTIAPLGAAEVWTFTPTGTVSGGTYRITVGGQTTAAINATDAAGTIQAAVQALSTVGAGNAVVAGGPATSAAFTVTFGGALVGRTQAVSADPSGLTGSAAGLTVSRTTPAVSPTTGGAIAAVLDYFRWTSPAMRSLAVGDVLPFFSADGTRGALQIVQDLLDAERGFFYVAKDGKVSYRSRNQRAVAASLTTVGHVAEELELGYDAGRVVNRWTVVRKSTTGDAIGTPQVATDAASSLKNNYVDGSIETVYLRDDTQALNLAQFMLVRTRDGSNPVWDLSLRNKDAPTLTAMLARELGDRITVVDEVAASTTDYWIEQIQHDVSDGLTHETTWRLSRVPAQAPFQFGSSLLGDARWGLTY